VTQTPELSVILPALNTGNVLCDTVKHIMDTIPGTEIVIVDDHSTDGTQDIAESLKREHPDRIKVLHHEVRSGKGYAIRDGVPIATGRFIAYMDADGVIDPHYFQQALSYMQNNSQLDLVFGQRAKYRTAFSRKIISLTYRCITSTLFHFPFWDTQAGMKVFRADAAKRLFGDLLSHGYAFDVELLARARAAHMHIQTINIQQEGNGRSSISTKRILETFKETLQAFIAIHSPMRG
jgi:glycosyltransferase involved in cell wall biosynthesis